MTDSSHQPLPLSEEPTVDRREVPDSREVTDPPEETDSGKLLGRSNSDPGGEWTEPPTRDLLFGEDNLPTDEAIVRLDSSFELQCDSSESFDFVLGSANRERSDEVPKQIGDYKMRGLIGSGGMGNVYLAEHVRMQRMVAIKMLPIERMQNEEAVERFYAEVRAASRLLHPNIVAAFDAGEVEFPELGKVHYLAMEYVEGLTLTQTIAQGGPMSIGEAASVIRQAALGLLHAHRAGITHRDVKPGNLMRAVDGTIKVVDLGLARIHSVELADQKKRGAGKMDDETFDSDGSGEPTKPKLKGRLLGTLPFMSPEQLEDPDSVDARSDIYSLGATLYFLLTATPPFSGEYLDQVYGHRHGEIPNLMEVRDDVDLNFANLFERMMAKLPKHRYQSLDEVIEDLAEYANQEDSANWLTEFTSRQLGLDASTVSGGSTSGSTAQVLGIDMGMMYSAAAKTSSDGSVVALTAGAKDRKLFRMAIASNQDGLTFDSDAISVRATHSQSMVHCVQMYLGKDEVSRDIAGRRCPPEVLLAILLRRVFSTCWSDDVKPHATAITVPASYDQLHRRSILQAAQMAGFSSIRLVDRSIAAVQSLGAGGLDHDGNSRPTDSSDVDVSADSVGHVLFLGVTGQATEVAIVRRQGSRLHQLATTGHWHGGTLPWLHRLVDLASKQFICQHGRDPKSAIHSAAQLQIACENAMNAMMILPNTQVEITMHGKPIAITIQRDHWLAACSDLIEQVREHVQACFHQASLSASKIDTCLTLGAILRMPGIREQMMPSFASGVTFRPLDRSDVARGAAACLSAELPGRSESGLGDLTLPPRVITSHTIGILIEDAKGRRRILPIIPRGTLLPARTNRRLNAGKDSKTMKVSLVESSGIEGDHWQALGRYDIDVSADHGTRKTRTISFEINVNGLLTVRVPMPSNSPSRGEATAAATVSVSRKLPALPTTHLNDENMATWKQWIETVV